MPAGYVHARGALAAALNYIGDFGDPGALVQLRAALMVLATAQLAPQATAEYRAVAAPLSRGWLPRSVRALLITMGVPVGYRVVISTPNRLTAECGTVGVIGDLQATAPRALWGRRTAALRPV